MQNLTAPNASRLFAKRRNLATLQNEYIQVVVKDYNGAGGAFAWQDIFQPEEIFHTDFMGIAPMRTEEMQISPDGTLLVASRNLGNTMPTQGGLLLFTLAGTETPQFINQMFSAPYGFSVESVDFSPNSSHLYYTRQQVISQYTEGGNFNPPAPSPSVRRRNIYSGNSQSIGTTNGGVRRLADGRMYFKDAANNNLHQVNNPDAASPNVTTLTGWGSDNLTGFLVANAVVRGLSTNQPHRIYPNNKFFTRTLGKKHYELTDHTSTTLSTGLGNVRATITDRKIASFQNPQGGNWTITGFSADITTAQDYYPATARILSRGVDCQ